MFNFFNDDFFPDTGFTIFSILPVMFVITFATIFFIIIATIVSSLRTNARNNAAPRLKSQAKVVSRRINVHGNSYNKANIHRMHEGHTSTDYYITFEFEQGSRQEFQVDDYEYGTLIEGDSGILEHQGSRYLGFERMY